MGREDAVEVAEVAVGVVVADTTGEVPVAAAEVADAEAISRPDTSQSATELLSPNCHLYKPVRGTQDWTVVFLEN